MQFDDYAAPCINRQMNISENKADELFNVLPEIIQQIHPSVQPFNNLMPAKLGS